MASEFDSVPNIIGGFKTRGQGINADNAKAADGYVNYFRENSAETKKEREHGRMDMVNKYYDLVTDFYEYGWGQSFHFAPRFSGESFHESILRHEYVLAHKGRFGPGMKVLDIGCGVGGPMRAIARFSGCQVVGINNNPYQIQRGSNHNRKAGLDDLCSYQQSDFMNMSSIEDGAYDGAYAIEATCHSSDKVGCFTQIFNKLKPGASFVGYEWVMVEGRWQRDNAEHAAIKFGIEVGDALPNLETGEQVLQGLRAAGFEIIESYDVAEQFEKRRGTIPWYQPLSGSYTPSGFRATPLGRFITSNLVRVLEKVKLAPKGSYKTSQFLEEAAVNLVKGGEKGIFTPCFFFHARKPATGSAAAAAK